MIITIPEIKKELEEKINDVKGIIQNTIEVDKKED